ncbi:mitochondrial import receptor subunit TOM70 [Phlebotomus argentipes]|uniref:mitochondrial import receptor subunit TOM70 n=1 Tax=Phlebotomus argentipes TaxID=94469 RepID=UPI002892F4D5|nr:mitochondrial import receptor subunit TOM70 [Phlebotomus argentipes]XP_059615765.1 mitochondrial import receptor subunit TOM70 [Phlebotomus argentipes]XP_059615766.1 mitochondrial import receptor subunit TOM70 [Phlebotomus argentipes]
MTTGSTGSTFPKWQLAIILGAPVALTLGYLYYRRQTHSESEDRKKKLAKADKSVSIDGDEAKEHLNGPTKVEAAAKQSPLEVAMEFKNRGNERYRLGKFDESIDFYRQAIEACPGSNTVELATFYQNRAAAHEQLKQWSAVREDCTRALGLNPKYVKAYNRRAKAHEQLKDLSQSLEDITATCILEQFQNQSSIAFADRVLRTLGAHHATEAIKERKPVPPSSHFVSSFCEAFSCDPLKDIAVAAINPRGFMLAKTEFDQRNLDKVIPACTEELQNENSEYRALSLLLRGTMYQLMGLFTEALEDFATLIGDSTVSAKIRVNALVKRASIKVQLDNIEECFDDFSEAQKIDSANPDVYYHRGQMYVLLQRLQEAVEDFERTIELVPNFGMAYVQKLYVEYRNALMAEDPVRSFQLLEKFRDAMERFPKCVECYSIMAQILTEQQQYKEADQLFEKSIKMDPGNATLLVHRGILHLQWRGDVETALKYLQHAIEVDDKCEFAFETLASIEVQRGNMEKAIDLFNAAINLAKSETELRHLFSLKDAAIAQMNVASRMGMEASSLSALAASAMA